MPYAYSDPKRANRSLAVRTLCFECGFVHSSNATCASERTARRAATARVETRMTDYTISTDSCSMTITAETADLAAAEFAARDEIRGVSTVEQLVAYLERVGGYGTVSEDASGAILGEVSR